MSDMRWAASILESSAAGGELDGQDARRIAAVLRALAPLLQDERISALQDAAEGADCTGDAALFQLLDSTAERLREAVRIIEGPDRAEPDRLKDILLRIGVDGDEPRHWRYQLVESVHRFAVLKCDHQLEASAWDALEAMKAEPN